jgi:hypothetical protein
MNKNKMPAKPPNQISKEEEYILQIIVLGAHP